MNSTIDNTLSQVLSIVEFLKVKKVILIFYDSGWVESTHYSSLFGLSNFSFIFKGQIPHPDYIRMSVEQCQFLTLVRTFIR